MCVFVIIYIYIFYYSTSNSTDTYRRLCPRIAKRLFCNFLCHKYLIHVVGTMEYVYQGNLGNNEKLMSQWIPMLLSLYKIEPSKKNFVLALVLIKVL